MWWIYVQNITMAYLSMHGFRFQYDDVKFQRLLERFDFIKYIW